MKIIRALISVSDKSGIAKFARELESQGVDIISTGGTAELLRKEKIAGWRRHQRLPGRPDFVFARQRLAIFVDGCFWHGCNCRSIPVTRRVFWRGKIQQNRKRDKLVNRQLRAEKWTVLRFWEHELMSERHIIGRIRRAFAKMERASVEARRK